jgi:proteasome lid subunit RPN8/RPN11
LIRLAGSWASEIRAHARETYPEECCGALLGRSGPAGAAVDRVIRVENTRPDSRARRFEIRPEQYARLEQEAEREALELLGFYHSHPDHPARPSEFDREHALPSFHYLIVSVPDSRPGAMTSWRLSEDRAAFERETLRLEGEE